MMIGLFQIMEMNKQAGDHKRGDKKRIVKPGPWRPLTIYEVPRLNERMEEEREIEFDPSVFGGGLLAEFFIFEN